MVPPQQSMRFGTEPPSGVRAEAWRVAYLVRELRRAAGSQRFRSRLYGTANVLDPGQHDALDAVVAGGRARMHELADRLRVDRSTATRTIERLEKLGLVERRPDPDDSRYVVVIATRNGRRRHHALAERSRASFDALFERFSDRELALFGDHLERLVDGIDGLMATDQDS